MEAEVVIWFPEIETTCNALSALSNESPTVLAKLDFGIPVPIIDAVSLLLLRLNLIISPVFSLV